MRTYWNSYNRKIIKSTLETSIRNVSYKMENNSRSTTAGLRLLDKNEDLCSENASFNMKNLLGFAVRPNSFVIGWRNTAQ